MRTTITMLAAAVAALTATTAMARTGERRFVHDGSTYVYTTNADAGGRTVISGRRLPAGEPFRLIVKGERVSGYSGNTPVSFRTAAARGAAGGIDAATD